MKYTKEQLQAMSDFEVNKALCVILGKDVSGVSESWNQMTGAVPNFCLNHESIMPIQVEHKIGIQPVSGEWQAFSREAKFCIDKNPLRAIACCLILALQGEKE